MERYAYRTVHVSHVHARNPTILSVHKRERRAQTLDFPSTGHIREREPLFVHLIRLRGSDRHFAWPGTTGHEPADVV